MSKEKKKSAKSKTASEDAGQVNPASPVEQTSKKAAKKSSAQPSGKAKGDAKKKKSDQVAAVERTAKPSVRKVTAKKSTVAKAPVVISYDDIALRAYFIAERRNFFGAPGDAASDWIEAERQLRAEAEG